MPSESIRNPAVLLLGPTGAGKTPLGDLLAERGLRGGRTVHFDFGDNLRRVVARGRADSIVTAEDIAFLRHVLESGALLEDEHFPIAERILRSFLAEHQADGNTLVLLNGLPRHVGQAEAVDAILDLCEVIHLDCPAETVLARIESNVGGDRSERSDDNLAAIRNKLDIFHRRTAPLLEHYQKRGTPITLLEVTATMTPEDAWRKLSEASTSAGRAKGNG